MEDSSVEQKILSKIIKSKLGADNIFLAEDGEEAYEIFQNNEIDIILSDWDMPIMNGEELIYNIRNKSKNKNVPFIMVTGHGGKDFIMTAIQNGVSHYIVKPFTPADIVRKVRECLKLSRHRSSPRYCNIPDGIAYADIHGFKIESIIIDISLTGLLLDLTFQDSIVLYGDCSVNFDAILPWSVGKLAVGPLLSSVVRLEACANLGLLARRCRMGLNFKSDCCNNSAHGDLKKLIKWMHESLSQHEQNMLSS